MTGRQPVRGHHTRAGVVAVSARAELVRSGVGHALGAAVLSLVVVAGVVVVGWTSAADPLSSARGAAGIGGALWVSAHLVDLSLGQPVAQGGPGPLPVTLSPLGLTVILAALHVRSGRRLVRLAETWHAGRATLAGAVIAGAATTASVAAAVAVAVSGQAIVVSPVAAFGATGCFALVAMGVGVGSRWGPRMTASMPDALAEHVRRCAPAVLVAVTCWLLAGSVLITVGLIVRVATVAETGSSLAPGAFGGVWLLAAQIILLPNALTWAAGLLSGVPLQAMDQAISLAGSDVTSLPPLPLFSVTPAPGVWPLWAWAGVALVVVGGVVAGWRAFRQRQLRASSVIDRCADALAIGATTGAMAALATWAAHGSVAGWGPVGGDPFVVGLAVAVEVAAGALLSGVTLHLISPRAGRR